MRSESSPPTSSAAIVSVRDASLKVPNEAVISTVIDEFLGTVSPKEMEEAENGMRDSSNKWPER